MKRNCALLLLMLMTSVKILSQENGVLFGLSYSGFNEKMTAEGSTYSIGSPDFNYHLGYQYRQNLKNKFSLDLFALYGMRSGDLKSTYGTAGGFKNELKFKYLSIGSVFNYNFWNNFNVGLGAEPTWYFDTDISFPNTIKPILDVPIVGKISYSFKHFDLSLSYKQGTCNLLKNNLFEGLKSHDLQLSVYIPLFNKNR